MLMLYVIFKHLEYDTMECFLRKNQVLYLPKFQCHFYLEQKWHYEL